MLNCRAYIIILLYMLSICPLSYGFLVDNELGSWRYKWRELQKNDFKAYQKIQENYHKGIDNPFLVLKAISTESGLK